MFIIFTYGDYDERGGGMNDVIRDHSKKVIKFLTLEDAKNYISKYELSSRIEVLDLESCEIVYEEESISYDFSEHGYGNQYQIINDEKVFLEKEIESYHIRKYIREYDNEKIKIEKHTNVIGLGFDAKPPLKIFKDKIY